MTSLATQIRPTDGGPPPGAAPDLPAARLHLEFASEQEAREYVSALTSLLHGAADSCLVVDASGRGRDDLELGEITHRIKAKGTLRLRLLVRTDVTAEKVEVALDTAAVDITARVLDARATRLAWFQASTEQLGPVPVLALPVHGAQLTLDALHPLVGLGTRTGGLRGAKLHVDGETTPRCSWATEKSDDALPVVVSHETAIWAPATALPASTTSGLWFTPEQPRPVETTAPAEWWSRFDDLARSAATSPTELESHLRQLVPDAKAWRLGNISAAQHADFMTPVEDGLAIALVPKATEVVVAVDLHLPAEVLQPLLLHAIAHLALGHVRPGDKWGHWDTSATATTTEPHRIWDREAKKYVEQHLKRQVDRRIDSLDDCTPTEKAQLGLWRMIGEMLGESRRLHPVAERYQKAAYQRQAAQRMVAMLEDYGGAMLCDGVGLGKTYVATTLMVHYANCWRDQWASTPDRLVEDPLRITVLAPNSVVSTWRREALPALASFGVPLATVRVVSHTKLSRMSRASEMLEPVRGGTSDLEHLLLSDLVIVDEAHNFRSLAARRTKVLRDLLRLQPRREARRRVALLTATPLNNSLDDLRQEVSLLFSRPLLLSDAKTDDGYRRQAVKEIQDRCARARSSRARGDVAGLVVHGQADAKFSDTIEFRDDLDFGPNVQRIGDYLKEQDKRLKELQASIRAAAQNKAPREEGAAPVRIAEELLDRIVVQRSRALCKEIERQQASNVELLFRPDAEVPEKLYYSDEYDGIEDALARFLPLFDGEGDKGESKARPLSLKVYMWYDVREGLKSADEMSSVVGLQRILVLKRLESSPVSFLITLLRLTVLHAHRLQQLGNLCLDVSDSGRHRTLQAEIKAILDRQKKSCLDKVRTLATGETHADPRRDFLKSLSTAYSTDRPAADTDDPLPQLSLFSEEDEGGPKREQLDRLWSLRESLVADFETLLAVTPDLADIVFGKFDRAEWPRRFIAGGESIDWPRSAQWGLRLVTDAKIRQLVSRLVLARRAQQKVIVFSQFSDTIAYVRSVLISTQAFERSDWQMAVRGLGVPNLSREEILSLRESTMAITGDTEDRDDVVNAFAPFYRIGPWRPATEEATELERALLWDSWETAWQSAMARGIDVLISSDVLAEGVNLQDAALLVNFDVHWNPVRMIQRSGRIDRRLNPRIEQPHEFPDLAALATRASKPVPRYYWHAHPDEAPVTVNMILPDELEAELQLRERIATKTMAIDFTLGLEQGTGAEADWMESYKYHGITSLNSFQKDRAIEQIASHHERLSRRFVEIGIQTEWAKQLNGWFRESAADAGAPLIGRSRHGRRGGDQKIYSRYLQPTMVGDVPHWLWSQVKPSRSLLNFWLCLDGKNFPAQTRNDIEWKESSSLSLAAGHLLAAVLRLEEEELRELPPQAVGRPLMQGVTALSAGFLGNDADRREISIAEFLLLQLCSFEVPGQTPRESQAPRPRRGLSRACPTCGHPPAMHKCCPRCRASADGEAAIDETFGFRVMTDSKGRSYEVPQPWCKSCRSGALAQTQELGRGHDGERDAE